MDKQALDNVLSQQDMLDPEVHVFSGWGTVYDEMSGMEEGKTLELKNGYATIEIVKHVVNHTGYNEGDVSVIFKYDGKFYRKTGKYNSWDSSIWDDGLVEVEPFPISRIEYREI